MVLTTIQSWDNEGPNFVGPQPGLRNASQNFETTVSRNISVSGFELALEVSEVDDDDAGAPGIDNPESIGYVAIEDGVSANLVPLSGGSVGLATGFGTATGTCGSTVLNGLSFPSAPSAPSLRGFAGKQTRSDSDGGWLRRCALTTPGGNAVSMTIDVDEDQDGDTERTHAASETVGAAIFGDDFITSPVSLAYAQTRPSANGVEFSFAAATEVGTLGYRLWGRVDEAAEWELLDQSMIPATSPDGMSPRSYSRQIARGDLSQIRIEDIDILGRSRYHAPVDASPTGSHQIGTFPDQPAPIDWAAIRASNLNAPVRVLPRGATFSARISVTTTGPQQVAFEQFAALGLPAGTATNRIALSDADRAVPRAITCIGPSNQTFGPGCTLEFLGEERDSLYGSENVYQLRVQNVPVAGAVLEARSGNFDPNSGASVAVGVKEKLLTRQLGYSISAPGDDPWFDTRMLATSGAVEHHVDWSLPNYAGGTVQLAMRLWGGLDFPGQEDDHSVQILLNGVLLESRRFNGLRSEEFYFDLPQSAIAENNRVTLRLPLDTGFATDLIYLDEMRLSYPQFNQAVDGELQLGQFSQTAVGERLLESSFEDATLGVLGVHSNSVLWSERDGVLYRDEVSQDGATYAGTHAIWLLPRTQIATPQVSAAVPPIADTRGVQYLIISAPEFESELTELVALQQGRGYQVEVLRTDQIYARYSDFEASPFAIAQAIQSREPRFVLLVGGDSYDYHNYLGLGAQSLLPTFYRAADEIVRFAASDADFADYDRDGAPELAIGRIPARTSAQLQLALGSLLERAAIPPERYFATSGQSAPGERFGAHSRSLLSHLRQGQAIDFALVDEVGLGTARAQTIQALAGDADWINYAGHSSPSRWGFENLLNTQGLASITRTGPGAVISQWGCWNNYFVLPDQNSMADALMFDGNGLAAAVIGSSSLAEDASHMALAVRFFDLFEDGRFDESPMLPVNTLGEALMQAKRDLANGAPEHIGSNYSMQLFGDPAQPLR